MLADSKTLVEDLSEFINFNENKELEVKNMRGLGYSILEKVVKKGFKLPYVYYKAC